MRDERNRRQGKRSVREKFERDKILRGILYISNTIQNYSITINQLLDSKNSSMELDAIS